jgi:hypothetical protein
MRKLTKQQVIELILKRKEQFPTWGELARKMGTSQQHLSDVVAGRREPGPAVLIPLGLRKISYFVKITARDK